MASKFFQKVNMSSESTKSFMRTALFQVSGSNAACDPGSFVVPGALAANALYTSFNSGSTIYDINTFTAAAPAAVTSRPVCVADPVKVMDGTIGGQTYRIGARTLSLQAAAGEKVAVRELDWLDQFIVGDGNFASAPTLQQYAILTAGCTVLSPSAAIPGTGFCVRVEDKKTITEGVEGANTGYLCTVVQL